MNRMRQSEMGHFQITCSNWSLWSGLHTRIGIVRRPIAAKGDLLFRSHPRIRFFAICVVA